MLTSPEFSSGDSAGANIAHNMMMRASVDEDKLGDGLKIVGMALVHPYFGNNEPDRIYPTVAPKIPKPMTRDSIQQHIQVCYRSLFAPTF
ncbi:hypothetical protein HAX54_037307 [Datura stramonium]|uniref:Alpha/beta hydrolase fold-3 domain-containing protein n=1 Tax=Datura stramonium TaxID=4076 RepID=A0ABS8RHL7_DATST|nr:hypothetical protein [Datura stramonium]